MQYWLINYGPTCPANDPATDGWKQTPARPNDCYTNSLMRTPVPAQTIGNLAQLRLTGQANAGGMDTVIISTGNNSYMATGQDSVLNVAPLWQVAEFNVFGVSGGSQAKFNPNSTIVVWTSLNIGANIAPSCWQLSFTAETNNLNLGPPAMTIMAGTLRN